MLLEGLASAGKSVVILVDNKTRDLDGAALIAHHLKKMGIECHLEPLEAFRAVLAARKPAMIIFNLITASHLVAWSKRLRDMGVLTGIILNEGLFYDDATMRYNIGRFHRDAHIDVYFCWNKIYADALIEEGMAKATEIEIVGVHRFDFYFKPWSNTVERPAAAVSSRPKLLVCTNFIGATQHELAPELVDRVYVGWAKYVPLYRNYRQSVLAHWIGRKRFFDHLNALLDADKYEITLRPHPLEGSKYYEEWMAQLPAERRRHLHLAPKGQVVGYILETDLEISCETCTTAIESWIAGKPTIELIFERDPLWFHEEHSRANVGCENPSDLVSLVDDQLHNKVPAEVAEARKKHIDKWCSVTDGSACLNIATTIERAIRKKAPTDWSQLQWSDYRRAFKLHLYNFFDQAYHFDILLGIKYFLFPKRYAVKYSTYLKSIRPSDVRAAKDRIMQVSVGREP